MASLSHSCSNVLRFSFSGRSDFFDKMIAILGKEH